MKKRVWMAALLGLTTALVGCQGTGGAKDATGQEKLKVGVVQYIDHVSLDAARQGFEDTLKKSGLDVEMEFQNANGDSALTNTIPQGYVGEGVDLIYAIATPSAQGAKNVTQDVPIVFSCVTDPAGAELVTGETPEGNVTGVSDRIDPKVPLKEFQTLYPNAKTLGVIYNTGEQNSRVQLDELKAAAKEVGFDIKEVGISSVNDVGTALSSIINQIDGLYALTDNTVASAAPIVTSMLLEKQIPSVSAEEGQVKNGWLFSVGIDYYEQGVQAGNMAVEILKNHPEKLPKVEVGGGAKKLVNLETAKKLNLELPKSFMEGAETVQ